MTQLQLNVIFSIEQMCIAQCTHYVCETESKTTNETKDERKHNKKADF